MLSGSALFARNENIALLKAQKAKTVASGFKVTELVNFLVCFAELKEKDLIECYCLRISINNHKNLPVVIFFSFLQRLANYGPGLGLLISIERERENHGATGREAALSGHTSGREMC